MTCSKAAITGDRTGALLCLSSHCNAIENRVPVEEFYDIMIKEDQRK